MMATRWFATHPKGLYVPPDGFWNTLLFLNANSNSSNEIFGTFEMLIRPTMRVHSFKVS